MEVETLNSMINELLKRVSKGNDRGLQTLPAVEKWISKAEEIESKASSLLDESISECHNLSSYEDFSLISQSTIHYCETVCMTLKEAKALRSEGVFKVLVERVPLSHVKKMLPLRPVVSQEMLLEKAWKCLAENECRTLGLHGVAGVGKTTLLTQIRSKFIEAGYVSSSRVLFVVVECAEVEGIQVTIMERLGIYWSLERSQREKASDIYEFLNRKRFVLLLDGVQREGVNLEEIGVPLPSRENGCKIVFTSRSQGACRNILVDTEFEVKCLSPEEACDFFQDVVGETALKSHPDIPQLARIVSRKCGGFPIALSLIGQTMSGKETVREWHHAIHVLVSSTVEFSGMEPEVLPILKFTYDNLPGENIKSCFLYCARLPKKCDIRKEDLVDYWIGEGIISKEEDREIAEIQGYEMMGDLISMGLLMEDESGYGVKMHGLVREMALWIASDFGRQKENLLEKAWKCLAENECRTFGLYGVAGVGKTTLLTQIKNKFIEDGDASTLVLFVVVESEEDVEGIQDTIMKRLGIYRYWLQKSQLQKASEIYEFLNRKRFVLLLDGVQREGMDLAGIGVPQPSGENGCKIVFTTSFQEACRSMLVDTEVEVKCLSPEEACHFFQDVVGETALKSHPDIPQLARIVARKCGGLPIALSLIGQTMSSKRTVREWHHAIHVLVSSTTEFSGMEPEVLPILKLTYDNLPGENIKSCFLYCALLRKHCYIRKEDLVDYWIGEGIIAKEEEREIAEIQGYQMMDDLVSMRFLMEDESGYLVKMHGMVRELALWIASDFGKNKENFVVVGGEGIHHMPEVNDWRIVRRMSVTSTQIEKITDSPNCPMLTTLFLQENNLKWISGDFFRWMTSLVVLNLSRNREISDLPEEVSSLVSLRLLNLSWTWIKRLPLGLKELKRLIHLDLDDTPFLREIDVICCLLNLQVLRLLRSVPMDLSLMEDVQLLKSLKDLSLTVKDVDVLKRLLSIHQVASCIRHLHLRRITITDGGILLLNSMLSLRELNIWMCDIPEMTIQRETLHFGNIEKFPLLQNIRTVTLYWCTCIRDLTWLLFAPNLGDLTLHECQHIEQIINQDKATADTSEQPFQNLTRLRLSSLPKLESIYWAPLPFPVLEYLYIRGCPNLRRLPFNSDFAKEYQVLSDLDQWMQGVEWEDEATKQHFSDFDDRDFPSMAEADNMDGLASESHPIKDMVMVETAES